MRGRICVGRREIPRAGGPAAILIVFLMIMAGPVAPPKGSSATLESTAGTPVLSGHPTEGLDHRLSVSSTSVAPIVGRTSTFYAAFPNGSFVGAFDWQFGDGGSENTTAGFASYVYEVPGIYLVSVTAIDRWGGLFDNLAALLPLTVSAAGPGAGRGNLPALSGNVTANTTSRANPLPVIAAGGYVGVAVITIGPVTDASTLVGPPSFSATGAGYVYASPYYPLDANGTNRGRIDAVSTTPPGIYQVNFSIPTSTPLNNSWLNATARFIFDIAVGPVMAAFPIPAMAPPTPSLLRVEEYGRGVTSLDPALAHDGSSDEVIANVYQTLLSPNGTRTGQDPDAFVPTLAACVPGSVLCVTLFGTRMVNQANVTFVLANQSFFDPARNASWSAYPTDVLFSVARALAFADQPCAGCGPGWILAQALLPTGNATWDGGVHYPYNNTPSHVFAALSVNDSAYCPGAARTDANGCVTFHANGGGTRWPELLATLSQPFPGSVVPCGWTSARPQRTGIPFWTLGNVTGTGDRPCGLPGSTGFGVSPASMPMKGWDLWEKSSTMPSYSSGLQWKMAGSGPYYLASVQPNPFYSLKANPAYHPVHARIPGSSIPRVNVSWTTDGSRIASDLAAGVIDVAVLPAQTYGRVLAEEEGSGLAVLHTVPTMQISFDAFNLNYSVAAAENLTGRTFTAPPGLFTDLNLRQFLSHSLPISSLQSRAFSSGGIPTRFPYAGVLPTFLGGVSTANVSGPSITPDPAPADVVGAAGWWNRTSHDGSAGARCTPASPCTFPMFYPDSDPASEAIHWAWANSTRNLSAGAIVPVPVNVSFRTIEGDTVHRTPGSNPIPLPALNWATDFVEPSVVLNGLFGPSSGIAVGDAVLPQFAGLNNSGCPSAVSYWSSLATPISLHCQGVAYRSMVSAIDVAHAMPLGPARSLLFNMIDQVAARLALYTGTGQLTNVAAAAPWVVPTSLESAPWFATWFIQRWDSARFTSAPVTPLALLGPVPTADPVALGQPVDFSAQAVGGTGGYSYSWSGLPMGCAAHGSTVACAPTTSGGFSVVVRARDGSSGTVTAPLLLEVDGTIPRVLRFTAAPTTVAVNVSTELAVRATGGSLPYSFDFAGLPPGCVTANLSHLPCTPTAAGSYSVTVTVTDKWGLAARQNALIRVVPAGTTSLVLESVTASAVGIDLGDSVTFTIVGRGGLSPFYANFSGIPGCTFGLISGSNPPVPFGRETVGCSPTAVGAFNGSLNITDSLGSAVSTPATVVVHAAPALSGLSASSSQGEVGIPLSLNASILGGTAPYAIVYSGLPTGCASSDLLPLPCIPESPGSYAVGLNVTDASNHTVSSHLSLTVRAHLEASGGLAIPSLVVVGKPLVLSVAAVTGGVTPYRFEYQGLPPGCASSNLSALNCTPRSPGSYTVTINITDAIGVRATVSASVLVTLPGESHPAGGQPRGLAPIEAYSLLGIAAIAAVGVVAALAMHRFRRSPPPRGDGPGAPDDPPVGAR